MILTTPSTVPFDFFTKKPEKKKKAEENKTRETWSEQKERREEENWPPGDSIVILTTPSTVPFHLIADFFTFIWRLKYPPQGHNSSGYENEIFKQKN